MLQPPIRHYGALEGPQEGHHLAAHEAVPRLPHGLGVPAEVQPAAEQDEARRGRQGGGVLQVGQQQRSQQSPGGWPPGTVYANSEAEMGTTVGRGVLTQDKPSMWHQKRAWPTLPGDGNALLPPVLSSPSVPAPAASYVSSKKTCVQKLTFIGVDYCEAKLDLSKAHPNMGQ